MILHDQHVHSEFSEDSNALIEKYYEIAKDLGCKYFVTTEHYDFDLGTKGFDWTVDFDRLKEKLSYFNSLNGPKCLLGIELGYRKDKLEQIINMSHSQNFDIINLSIHDHECGIEYYFQPGFIEYGIEKTLTMYFEEILEAVTIFDNFDVLSHIDYGFKTAYAIDHNVKLSQYESIVKNILETLIKKDKALEINTKVQTSLPIEHTKYLLNLYFSLGGRKLTLSSDAHEVERYRDKYQEYSELIKEAGFEYLCYFVNRKEYKFFL